MKIRLEVDEKIKEDEFIIRVKEINEDVYNIQKILSDYMKDGLKIIFYKKEKEYYLDLKEIIFFETDENIIVAHTRDDIYDVKYKLYELEEILPLNFIRVSKSTILNVDSIYSITRNITSSSIVEFQNTYKTVYVSRHYFKALKQRIEEVRR